MSDHPDDSTALSHDDEARLVAACQGGTLSAFDTLYTAYVHRIYGFLYRRTFHRATAEDLTSITFTKALEKIRTYKHGKAPFGAWLFQIARNTLTDHYRQLRPHADIENVWDLAADDDLLREAQADIDTTHLRAALDQLPTDKREIVLLRLWEGLSYAEIAIVTGKSEANCKVIFSRAIASLRAVVPATTLLMLFTPLSLP